MSRFGRSYARAFLEAIPSGYDVEQFLDRAAGVAGAISRSGELRHFLGAPSVPLDAKRRLLDDLERAAGVDAFGERFLALVLQNRRILGLGGILGAIRALRDRQLGIVEAAVTVAGAVGDAEKSRIEQALSRQLGRRVRMKVEVDPGILGGFVARVGSEVYDASTTRAIERFQEQAGEGRVPG